jgi:CheY-like chemotaxis protein
MSALARRLESPATFVLWIEDDVASIRSLVRDLTAGGCHVDVVSDGAAALECLAAASYDLILLDYKLSRETGFDVLERLRRVPGCPPVVLLSAYATLDLGVEAIRRGAVDVKGKPILGPELLPVVRAWRRPMLVTPTGIVATPWTTRTVKWLDQVQASFAGDVPARQWTGEEILRELGLALVHPDILIPEVVAGIAGFKSIALSTCLDADLIGQGRGMLVDAVFDRDLLDPVVAEVVARFEAGGRGAQRLREQDVAPEFNMSPSELGRRVRNQTKLEWVGWRFGTRLRPALRDIGAGFEPIKAVALNAGYAWPEDFSRDFRKAMGMSAEQFRTLVIVHASGRAPQVSPVDSKF